MPVSLFGDDLAAFGVQFGQNSLHTLKGVLGADSRVRLQKLELNDLQQREAPDKARDRLGCGKRDDIDRWRWVLLPKGALGHPRFARLGRVVQSIDESDMLSF